MYLQRAPRLCSKLLRPCATPFVETHRSHCHHRHAEGGEREWGKKGDGEEYQRRRVIRGSSVLLPSGGAKIFLEMNKMMKMAK
jgi:hypothetical protein